MSAMKSPPPASGPESKPEPKPESKPATATPLQAIQGILLAQKPASLLICSPRPVPGLSEYSNSHECQTSYVDLRNGASELATLQRFDFAIVADTLESLPKTAGRELLGRLHNLHSSRLCVLYSPRADTQQSEAGARWTAVDFFALGFKLALRFERKQPDTVDELQMYTYDVETYNHRRDWNNNRFWANPENFGKYWW